MLPPPLPQQQTDEAVIPPQYQDDFDTYEPEVSEYAHIRQLPAWCGWWADGCCVVGSCLVRGGQLAGGWVGGTRTLCDPGVGTRVVVYAWCGG